MAALKNFASKKRRRKPVPVDADAVRIVDQNETARTFKLPSKNPAEVPAYMKELICGEMTLMISLLDEEIHKVLAAMTENNPPKGKREAKKIQNEPMLF